jgi:hypothetical protein
MILQYKFGVKVFTEARSETQVTFREVNTGNDFIHNVRLYTDYVHRIKIACSYAGIGCWYNIRLVNSSLLHRVTYLFPFVYLALPESEGLTCITTFSRGSKLLDLACHATQLTKKSIESVQIAISTAHTTL